MATAAAGLLFSTLLTTSPLAFAQDDAPDPLVQPLSSGPTIKVVEGQNFGTCTATVVENRVFTAGHCGKQGDIVKYHSVEVGKIKKNIFTAGTGWDIAEIAITNPAVKISSSEVDSSYTPSVGDPVSKDGHTTGHTEGKVVDATIRQGSTNALGKSWPVRTWKAQLQSLKGDSGGPVKHNGKVVGIVQGGDTEEETTVTPISTGL